jgi:hypothetical protein
LPLIWYRMNLSFWWRMPRANVAAAISADMA